MEDTGSCFDGRGHAQQNLRRGSREEISLVQGKEQRLRCAGAAVKRYPMSKVRENPSKMVGVTRGHQRADRMKTTITEN